MWTTNILGFVRAEPQNKKAGLSDARAQTHVQKVIGLSRNDRIRTPDDIVKRGGFAALCSKSRSSGSHPGHVDVGNRFVVTGAAVGGSYARPWHSAVATALSAETACITRKSASESVRVEERRRQRSLGMGLNGALRGFETMYSETNWAKKCRDLKKCGLSGVVGLRWIANCRRTWDGVHGGWSARDFVSCSNRCRDKNRDKIDTALQWLNENLIEMLY